MIAPRNILRSVPTRPQTWGLIAFVAAAILLATLLGRAHATARFVSADPETILADPQLRRAALAAGKPVFAHYCAACHGATGKGDTTIGAPDLTDDDHLYGTGTVAQIEDIARYGIRAGNKHGWNLAVMPAYAQKVPDAAEPLPPQTPAQIEALTQFLLNFTGRATDPAAVARGRDAYTTAGCWDCHGRDLAGDIAIGAPALTDDIWIYGGSPAAIRRTLTRGRAGVSPAFAHVLSAAQLRSVAVYVAALAPNRQDNK